RELNTKVLDGLQVSVRKVAFRWMESCINQYTDLFLLRGRLEPVEEGRPNAKTSTLRHYLTLVNVPAHRLTLTRLLCGSLNIRNTRGPCLLCGNSLETPQHILLQCPADALLDVRAAFLDDIAAFFPLPDNRLFDDSTALFYLRKFIFHW